MILIGISIIAVKLLQCSCQPCHYHLQQFWISSSGFILDFEFSLWNTPNDTFMSGKEILQSQHLSFLHLL